MRAEKFFKDNRLPFAESRYSRSSQQQFKPHMHRRCSIGAVDRGEVEYSVAEQSALLSVGSLALINPETLHSCNALSSEGRSYYMLYLDIDWCHYVQKSLWKVDHFVRFSKIRLDDKKLYKRYCTTMKLLMDSEVHLLEKEQLLVDLVIEVFRLACEPQVKKEILLRDIEYLKKLMGENLNEDVILNSLAKKLGANPYTLLRHFKAATGITPHAYRMNCRIEQARKYLQQGMDISETALTCGFFDQSHLHRYFKAMTTVTPREYQINFVQ